MVTKSFQLLRTNPLLTTNLKIVVSSEYKLYLETFDTNKQLSDTKYKHVIINKDKLLESYIPNYYNNLPVNIAYDVKYDKDNNIMYNNYDNQFDDIYYSGAKNVEDQWYNEEFEYFAPLYIKKNKLPTNFVILRIDEPVVYETTGDKVVIGNLNKDNFRTEIIDKWKCVTMFDLSKNSDLGIFLNNNINENTRFPEKSFELDIKKYNFSRWYGMDYDSGLYTQKSLLLDDKLFYENPDYNLEKYITNGYRDNKIIYPHIYNLKFLFDDTPATPISLRKWSMNRYLGFYIDELQPKNNLTSYVTPKLKNNIVLINNIFIKDGTSDENICPFIDGWDTTKKYYIYIDNEFHSVERVYNNVDYVYKVLSTKILDSLFDVNTVYDNTITITYDKDNNINLIKPYKNDIIKIDYYQDISDETQTMDGDLYLIKIDNKYHVLKNMKTAIYNEFGLYLGFKYEYYIQTDYAINSNNEYLEYWINGQDSEYYKKINIYDKVTMPLTYQIYKVKFTDIKDFDFDRINTKFSDFDYEESYYTDTDEVKLYTTEFRDINDPQSDKVYDKGVDGQYKTKIISSEYITTNELFEIKNNDLSDIWRKNQSICKWGFQGSISHSDYPYKLNNNQQTGYKYNRTVNPFIDEPSVFDKNLDYFYRVGSFYRINKENNYFYNQSTNIITKKNDGYNDLLFNINDYYYNKYDVFTKFFNNIENYNDFGKIYKKQYEKFAVFNNGSTSEYSSTLFKGLKINVEAINNFLLTTDGTNQIQEILKTYNKNYNNYKISIILNEYVNCYDFTYDETTYYNTAIENYSGIIDNINKNKIHIFLNEKYENILIIINVNTQININYQSHNSTYYFGNNHYIYYGTRLDGGEAYEGYSGSDKYNPKLLTAYNFINAINNLNDKSYFDDYVTFYYIDSNNKRGKLKIGSYDTSTMTNLTNWNKKETPFILTIEKPNLLELKKYSYYYEPIQGPDYNIYDKFKILASDKLLKSANIDDYLARKIDINEAELIARTIKNKETIDYTDEIYRFSGSYEPIFKNIQLFNCYKTWLNDTVVQIQENNIFFDTSLKNFGKIEEIIYSKVNTKENLLKLKNVENDKSIYPMVDEFGYSYIDRFVFQSNWDKDFFIQSSISTKEELVAGELIVKLYFISGITSTSGTIINNNLTVSVRNSGNVSRSGFLYLRHKEPNSSSFVILPYTHSITINGNTTYEYTTDTTFDITGFGEHQFSADINGSPTESAYAQYTVIPLAPVADFIPVSSGITEGQSINFQYVHTPSAGMPDVYEWTFNGGTPSIHVGDASVASSVNVTYDSAEYSPYSVTLRVYNANIIDSILTRPNIISVEKKIDPPLPDFSFYNGLDEVIAADINVNINLVYEGGGGIPNKFEWSMPGGIPSSYSGTTVIPFPTVKYMTSGTKTVTLTATNESGSIPVSRSITINPISEPETEYIPLVARYIFLATPVGVYTPDTIFEFTDTSENGIENGVELPILSRTWKYNKQGTTTWYIFGTSEFEDLTFPSTGTYYVKLIVTDIKGSKEISKTFIINTSSCLSVNTPIPMFDGTWKRLGNLKKGDELKTFKIKGYSDIERLNWNKWSTSNLEVSNDKTFVKNITFSNVSSYYLLNDDIKVASGHPFLVKKYNTNIWKWITINNLEINDKIFDMNKTEITIYSLEIINIPLDVAIIDTEDIDCYFANGILVHNTKRDPREYDYIPI